MKKASYLIILALIVLLVGCNQNEDSMKSAGDLESTARIDTEKQQLEIGPVSITTGLPLEEENTENPKFSVMIENSPDARPHSGLVQADVVYEMEVEGNVTRFLALFNDDIPEKVGPARSSRHYYLPVAESWNMPYIHFGGSPQAYNKLSTLNVPTIDGMTQSNYFIRDSSRYAPHNAYLVTNQLDAFEEEPINEKFAFDEDASYEEALNSTSLEITYNNFTHVEYQYDEEANQYKRFLEGQPHADRETGTQISANNIIVAYANQQLIPGDNSGRIDITLTGTGEAVYFLDGQAVKGTWKTEDGNLGFYLDDTLIALNPGKTWVQVVDASKKENVSY
ncbi:DUF3048 domain-containing protein [Paraliobacillus sp. X-1268]|uniref:DUF3048 domain-containing protein n=1 Tax=Paraliobacillus sp. X-1268 TaxID=2213193 RepID=UPI000E3DF49C|nr:DUF3048 domain-containing protein [Paraliobacillus sp. X-1268]